MPLTDEAKAELDRYLRGRARWTVATVVGVVVSNLALLALVYALAVGAAKGLAEKQVNDYLKDKEGEFSGRSADALDRLQNDIDTRQKASEESNRVVFDLIVKQAVDLTKDLKTAYVEVGQFREAKQAITDGVTQLQSELASLEKDRELLAQAIEAEERTLEQVRTVLKFQGPEGERRLQAMATFAKTFEEEESAGRRLVEIEQWLEGADNRFVAIENWRARLEPEDGLLVTRSLSVVDASGRTRCRLYTDPHDQPVLRFFSEGSPELVLVEVGMVQNQTGDYSAAVVLNCSNSVGTAVLTATTDVAGLFVTSPGKVQAGVMISRSASLNAGTFDDVEYWASVHVAEHNLDDQVLSHSGCFLEFIPGSRAALKVQEHPENGPHALLGLWDSAPMMQLTEKDGESTQWKP